MCSLSMLIRRFNLQAFFALALTGCATTGVPELISTKPVEEIAVAQVQKKPQAYIGKQVRWGGAIIKVENFKESSVIELLSRRLSSKGKPVDKGSSKGRFLVTVPGFIDPEEYPKERLLTISGKISKVAVKKVGEYPYTYPMVVADAYHLWPEVLEDPYPYYHRPYYHDPWGYPWRYPWYGYPYYW